MVITQQQFNKAMEEVNQAFRDLNSKIEALQSELKNNAPKKAASTSKQKSQEKAWQIVKNVVE